MHREQEAWCTVQVAGSYLRMSSCQTNSESAKTSAARGSAGPAPAACMAARKEHATEMRCDTAAAVKQATHYDWMGTLSKIGCEFSAWYAMKLPE